MFEQLLDRQLLLGLDNLGLETATPVQEAVVPAALSGGDLKISAETGSGKTLAYLLPMAQKILDTPGRQQAGTLGLILVPTRELAHQVLKHCRGLLASSPLKAEAITGGAAFKYQKAIFRKNPEIIIATPGRLVEHIRLGSTDFSALSVLVLDEADRLLSMGFSEDVLEINQHCAPQRQALLLSATLKHKGLGSLTKELLQSPTTISIGVVRQPHSNIQHQIILADSQNHKDQLLCALLKSEAYKRVLVFSTRRITADRLAALLRKEGVRVAPLHGELRTEDRKRVVTQFSDGKLDAVCASELAARGLDIESIDLVLNYDTPYSGDDYLHRSGRTGRADASGLAISLVAASEWNLMISIQRYLKLNFEQRQLPGLKGKYNGPGKTKSSGKAVGSKKKKAKPQTKVAPKKTRRPSKSKGKGKTNKGANDGFAPLTKKRRG